MSKYISAVLRTIRNSIYLSFLLYASICLVNVGQGLPGVRAVSNKKLKELTKYMRPLKNAYGQRYCSSSSLTYEGKSYTLTNRHCCESENVFEYPKIRVGNTLETILYTSNSADVCILTSSLKSPLKLAKKEFELYDAVLVLGYPRGEDLTPRFGHVLALDTPAQINYGEYYKVFYTNFISAVIFPGNSGSPVFNTKGEIVNLVFAGPHPMYLYGLTVPLVDIHKAFEDMVRLSN